MTILIDAQKLIEVNTFHNKNNIKVGMERRNSLT